LHASADVSSVGATAAKVLELSAAIHSADVAHYGLIETLDHLEAPKLLDKLSDVPLLLRRRPFSDDNGTISPC